MEHVEEQRLDDVVAMMAERDLRESVLGRERIQRTAAKATATTCARAATPRRA
jgi:hypothetical protein